MDNNKFIILRDQAFQSICPDFQGAMIYAEIENSESNKTLQEEINTYSEGLRTRYSTETIKERIGIKATRNAYRVFGKDPSRYRPACEQLARRIIQGKGLYYINTIVDLVNYVSLYSGYSTAALDADKIVGTNINLGIGHQGEPYEAIGRGVLNIENLPVYRDSEGGFATPTSDSTRTMVNLHTSKLLILINGYDGDLERIRKTCEFTTRLLREYASGMNIQATEY